MKDSKFVLGIHPTSRGFGWIVFETPLAPFDWGTVEVREDKQAGAIGRLEKLLTKYKPVAVALEQYEGAPAHRAPRIRRVAAAMAKTSRKHGADIAVYSRAAVAEAVAGSHSSTREEIAEIVARKIEPLRSRLPAKRKIWVGESPSLSLFTAAACALTWYAHHP
jgi:Holliday junction resolvasome RuvABC endonuclease subunit